MNTDTHRKFAQALFKNAGMPVNNALIDNVNYSIDNPTAWGLAMNSFMDRRNKLNQYHGLTKSPYDLFGIVSGGHRARNHDMLSALFLSAMNARAMHVPASHAMMASVAHFAADSMSNNMVKKMGTEGRNMFEALFNYQTRRNQNKSIF